MEPARLACRLHPVGPGRSDATARHSRLPSGQAQEYRDDGPDTDQGRQNPEQEGRLADGQPRQLLAREHEPRSADGLAAGPEFGHLSAHGGSKVVRRPTLGVDKEDPLTGLGRHADTLPRARTVKTSSAERLRRAGMVSAVGLLGVVAGALFGGPSEASGAAQASIVLNAGDVARVAGAPMGCRVVVRGVPPATMLDCRRAGPLAGTYGVLFGRSNVRVVRFESGREARIVFSAKHGGLATCCGASER
jgi:hypothetical protein